MFNHAVLTKISQHMFLISYKNVNSKFAGFVLTL